MNTRNIEGNSPRAIDLNADVTCGYSPAICDQAATILMKSRRGEVGGNKLVIV